MTKPIEITDALRARQFLLETWGLARGDTLTAHRLRDAMRVALELASDGEPVVPLGFISDLVVALRGFESSEPADENDVWTTPVVDASLVRRYEDYVLGKFAADMSLERAADELRKYKERDLDRALAYVIQQIQQRTRLPCVHIGPATIKALLSTSTAVLQAEFHQSLARGMTPATCQLWDELIQAVRNCGELLGAEDIFELASGTALSKFGQRLALRQVIEATQHLLVGLPKQKPASARRHQAVATNIHEEDLYPVGGFSSISNRGTIESLLRSELAYMETADRPDLFDIKYARDELLYYARDENQFFRRRVTVLFVLDASLTLARVKDVGQSWQRIVLSLAVIVAMVKTLTDWLASDALHFEILFIADEPRIELQDEWSVLEMIFRDEIHGGRLQLMRIERPQLRARSDEHARQSLCHLVSIDASQPTQSEMELAGQSAAVCQPLISELSVASALPKVAYDAEQFIFDEASDPWREALRALLTAVNL